jgi:hypothetical protein
MTLESRLLEYHAIALMAHVHGLVKAGLLDSEQAIAALTALAAASAGAESEDPHAALASHSLPRSVRNRPHAWIVATLATICTPPPSASGLVRP